MDLTRARGVLGLWDGHDAGAALVADGRLVFALSEERPTRRKRYSGHPWRALELCVAWARDHGVPIDLVAAAGPAGRAPHRLAGSLYAASPPHRQPLGLAGRAAMRWEGVVASTPGLRAAERTAGGATLRRRLRQVLDPAPPVVWVGHHEAHAFSALLLQPREGARVVTWDAFGGRTMATLRRADTPTEVRLRARAPWGLALLYGAVTVELGFREGDEGKVTGLAAAGEPDLLAPRILAMFRDDPGPPALRRPLRRSAVADLVASASREDVAAGLQAAAEALGERWLGPVMRADPGPLLAAGGVFANVALNRTLARLPGLDPLSVFPHMGDGGLAAGAAHRIWYDRAGALADPLTDLALGPEPDMGGVADRLDRAGLPHRRIAAPAAAAAEHLLAGRVVCRFSGRDELGPRALGNRSILFPATDPALARRVNRALRRDGFMPFGPVIREEDRDAVLQPSSADLRFMTAAAGATTLLTRQGPAAVHLDGTVRPQLVGPSHPLHAVLTAYIDRGGPPALIHTSFNLHGDPIVHAAAEAVDTFVESGLDVLFIGDREVGPGRCSGTTA